MLTYEVINTSIRVKESEGWEAKGQRHKSRVTEKRNTADECSWICVCVRDDNYRT